MVKRGRKAQGKTGKRAPKTRDPASASTIARLRRELDEANQRLNATSEVLAVLSSSSGNLQRTFQMLLKKATQVCGAEFGAMNLVEGNTYWLVANFNTPRSYAPRVRGVRFEAHPDSIHGRIIKKPRPMQVADIRKEGSYRDGHPAVRAIADKAGARTLAIVPMLKGKALVGTFAIYRKEVHPFTDRQIGALENFASQAVIAIENARLFNETKEALERQEGSAEILRAIAGAPTDAEQALQQIAETTVRLFDAASVTILLADDDDWGRSIHVGPSATRIVDQIPKEKRQLSADNLPGNVYRENRQIHIPDLANIDPGMAHWPVMAARSAGARTVAGTPLRRSGNPIGTMIAFRDHLAPFSAEELALLQSFADQAVIAIENARLFNEITEALERQTATADILKVIASSPSDLQPVFDVIAQKANHLIGGHVTAVVRFNGDIVELAGFTPLDAVADARLRATFPRPIADFPHFDRVRLGESVQVHEIETDPGISEERKKVARLVGYRSQLLTPLATEEAAIGAIAVTREAPGSFAPHHVELLRIFADQAVIAIENTRLFEEVQAKTRELTEALTYQTGSASILSVIASSPTDVTPVLNAIVESACEVCDSYDAIVLLKDGDDLRFSAHHGSLTVSTEKRPISRGWVAGRAYLDREPVHVRDILSDEGADFPDSREMSRRIGVRSVLSVPLLRDNDSIGAILLRRAEVNPFSDKQIALLQTFADQAVIALGNVRLFEQVQEKTRDLEEALHFQTASADVLKVISRSPDKLQPVLDAIVATSRELCESLSSTVFLFRDGRFHLAAESGRDLLDPRRVDYIRANPIALDQPGSALARAARERRTVHVPNSSKDSEANLGGPLGIGTPSALLSVPLIREDEVIGGITLIQSVSTPFTNRQIEAIESFADQAVIAISNTGLFEQVQQRTRELSRSLDDLRSAQDRLVQTEKLASLGQLTAGIAHEIKNPLNFVNNFSSLSVELIDELTESLRDIGVDRKKRDQLDEVTQTLKSNLEKIAQHGQRADSIVKNMLLHSREGSGELRAVDVNALVDESLNLAYHGARAEKPGFNITLERRLDPAAGQAEVFPQEVTRVLLNIISNGFYAATRRAGDAGNGFAPTLSAETRNLGERVEIRIRDNGIGMSADVKAKIFTPFFTTKPPGEGTGLGLSMSHDIIVKQHRGSIDVATEPGAFTEFIITLPRQATERKNTGRQG